MHYSKYSFHEFADGHFEIRQGCRVVFSFAQGDEQHAKQTLHRLKAIETLQRAIDFIVEGRSENEAFATA